MSIETVLVAGASGRTGRAVLSRLASTDWRVRALTRSDQTATTLDAEETVVGDLFEPGDAHRAVEGVDAVVTCVGSTALQRLRADRFVDGAGNRNLVQAADAAGVERFVMESSLGVDEDRASWMAQSFRLGIRPILEAKALAESAIREADPTHTILRPGVLTGGGPTDDVQVAEAGTGLWGAVSRADVARLLVASLVTPAAADRTLEAVRNPLLRDRAEPVEWHHP
jgi:uncharacterized protein YbjT (DUF2867 family)